MTETDELLTLSEAAERTGVPLHVIQYGTTLWTSTGGLRGIPNVVRAGCRWVTAADVLAYTPRPVGRPKKARPAT